MPLAAKYLQLENYKLILIITIHSIKMKDPGERLITALCNYSDCVVLLHSTRERKTAEFILREGFRFASQLSNSTDRVSPLEPVEIVYFLFQRKDYGTFTIVIAIPRPVYEYYTRLAMKKNLSLEDVLSISEPEIDDNEEYVYKLDPKFIAGFYDSSAGEFTTNDNYDPANAIAEVE